MKRGFIKILSLFKKYWLGVVLGGIVIMLIIGYGEYTSAATPRSIKTIRNEETACLLQERTDTLVTIPAPDHINQTKNK